MNNAEAKEWIVKLISTMKEETSGMWADPQYKDEVYEALSMANEALSVELQDHTDEKYNELMKQYKHLRKYASDLETKLSVEQTEWISVKDRLPEEHKAEEIAEERYLVTYTYENCKGNHICIGIDFYRDGEWQNHSEDVYEHVTAWMPLPSPYKGE